MKILAKVTILVLFLFLGGCMHHAGYYSGHSTHAEYGFSVSRHSPHHSYPVYYEHDYYPHNPVAHKPYSKHHSKRYNKHQSKHYSKRYNKYQSKHQSKHHNDYAKHYKHKKRKYYVKRESPDRYFSKSQQRHTKHSSGFTNRRPTSDSRNKRRNQGSRRSGNLYHRDI